MWVACPCPLEGLVLWGVVKGRPCEEVLINFQIISKVLVGGLLF